MNKFHKDLLIHFCIEYSFVYKKKEIYTQKTKKKNIKKKIF